MKYGVLINSYDDIMEAFEYDTTDSFVKHRIFDKEYGDKIANTLSGWN